ncbi:MAG: hypothetical protein DDG60_10410 [Anaerolineae bacterium]|nr:MAG: hypothetical protein DDG60_10410 [Anaerolineae bacterium]
MRIPSSHRSSAWFFALLVLFLTGCALHYARGLYFFTPDRNFQYQGVDDAYITYRYGWNWVHFGTLSWNESGFRRTEGFTNPLWVFLSALWAFSGEKDWLYPGVTLTSSLLTGGLLILLAQKISSERGNLPAISGLFLSAASPALWLHSTSGLESGVFGALLGTLAYSSLSEEARQPPAWQLGGFAGLVVWLRSDGFVYLLVIVGALLLTRNPAWKKVLSGLLLSLTLLYIWRLWNFGSLLPNTAVAKLNFGLAERLLPGLLAFLQTLPATFPFLLIGLFGLHEQPGSQRLAALFILGGWLAYYIYIGGDFFVERHLLGVIILSAALAAPFFEKIALQSAWKFALMLCLLVATIWLALWPDARFSYTHPKPQDPWILLGKEMARQREQYGTVVTFPAGKIPFFAGGNFIDELGLNDPYLATLRRERFIPGHAAGSHAEAIRLAKESATTYSIFAFSFEITTENINDVVLWVENTNPQSGVFHQPNEQQRRLLLANTDPFAHTLILQGR